MCAEWTGLAMLDCPMQPHDRKAFTHKRVNAVADYDLTREVLTGKMSPGCSNGSSSICASSASCSGRPENRGHYPPSNADEHTRPLPRPISPSPSPSAIGIAIGIGITAR